MMNQRGLTDSVSYPRTEIPGRKITYKLRSKRKPPAEPRWAKQKTRNSVPNQLNK